MTHPTPEIHELLASVKTLKEEAKLYRDDGDYEEAIGVLNEAVTSVENSGWLTLSREQSALTQDQKELAWHLSDCLGMLGGNYRRINRLSEASTAFQLGSNYEADSRYGVNSSYNLVNAIVLPIEAGESSAASQKEALLRAITVLERQVLGERRVDRWAWADLATCRLISGDVEGANEAFQRFAELADPTDKGSVTAVLQRISAGLARGGDPASQTVQSVAALLQ